MIAGPDLFLRVAAGVSIGAVVGSFAATAALRLANGRDAIAGRSCCDGCARQLGWAETVPILGYAWTAGQCRSCAARIDPFHLAGEGLGALVLTACLLVLPDVQAILAGSLCLLLLVAALIDVKTLRLPDGLTAGIAGVGLVLALIDGKLVSGLIAAIAAGGLLYALRWWLERRHARPMLGLGDVKLVAAMALWLGIRTPAMLALAAVLGLAVIVIRKSRAPLPFGPMIAVASFAVGILVPESWLS